ncbi:MAG: FmdE family protein [Nitrospiraceae bacterium]|nr:FmdE family protein [Nitrospiraceae bacterium]
MQDRTFESLLQESVRVHGHLCPGQVLGVRMSMLGLKLTGIEDPRGKDRKSIIVFVEIDRCATDAIQSVTGCSLGHRTMKFVDLGKMAATFSNIKTGRAVRLIAREDARAKAKELFPEMENKYTAQLEAYKVMTDDELFDIMDVQVDIKPEDMPGRPLKRVRCDACGEYVQDMRDIETGGKILCKSCDQKCYYSAVSLD